MVQQVSRFRRIVNVNVLPGEPLDGSGRVCIHLFVRDEKGTCVEPGAWHPVNDKLGNPIPRKIKTGPARGRLACDRKRKITPAIKNGVTTVTHRTEDPRAITCPKCMATEEYKAAMTKLGIPTEG